MGGAWRRTKKIRRLGLLRKGKKKKICERHGIGIGIGIH